MINLRKAAESCPDPTSVIDEGIAALIIQQNNYTVDGPKKKTEVAVEGVPQGALDTG